MSVKLECLGSNVTKVSLRCKTILFSYNTPVALWLYTDDGMKRYVTTNSHSRTTAKHIGEHGPERYLRPGDHFEKVSQETLESLIGAE